MAGVQWVGQDGNRYVKDSSGTRSVGPATNEGGMYWNNQGYSGISDPNAQVSSIDQLRTSDAMDGGGNVAGVSTTNYATGSTGDGGAAAKAAAEEAAKRAINEASRNSTQSAINSLGTELETGYANIDRESASIKADYDREAANSEKDYNDETVSNNQTLLRNKQNSLLAGAQGARGLRGTLASMGALGGDGLKLANRAVTTAVNQDLGEATETAGNNAVTLDKSIGKFREEDERRRTKLTDERNNQRTATEGKVESKKQGYFNDMAKLFGEIGDVGSATSWLNQAAGLNGSIASKTAVQATPFSRGAASFTPGTLAEYLAGNGDMTVRAQAGDQNGTVGNPASILAGRKRDEERQRTVAA